MESGSDGVRTRISQLRSFLIRHLGDHALQSPRFYIVTSFVYILMVLFLFGYGVIRRLDGTGISVSAPTLANILLACVVFLFALLSLLRITRPVRYEYAFFASAAWIAYSVIVEQECICCSSATLGTHAHGTTDAPSVLDALNHALATGSVCDNVTFFSSLHNALAIFFVVILYLFICGDNDYFSLLETALERVVGRKQLKGRDKRNHIVVDDNDDFLRDGKNVGQYGSSEDGNRMFSWLRGSVIVATVIMLAIPLSCNNASLISLEAYLLRIVLFVSVFLLRAINTYSGCYNIGKMARGHGALADHMDYATRVDNRYAEFGDLSGSTWTNTSRLYGSSSGSSSDTEPSDERLPPALALFMQQQRKENPRTPDTSQSAKLVIRPSERLEEIRNLMNQTLLTRRLVDAVVSLLVFALCGWFLIAIGIQIIAEFIILWFNIDQYTQHLACVTAIYKLRLSRRGALDSATANSY